VQDVVDAIPTTAMRGTDNAALASVVGALNDAAAAGAVTDVDTAMAYIKQLVTAIQLIPTTAMRGTDNAALASVLGALADATGSGAVSDAKTAMTYLKQIVTSEIAVKARTDTIPAIVYSRQVIPIKMNIKKTITATATTNEFLATNTISASGLLNTTDANVGKIFLMVVGRVENTYAGANNLETSNAAYNQWQVSMDAGNYADLQNGALADGQMLAGDWNIGAQNGIIGFQYTWECTAQITNIDGKIGLQLLNAEALQANLVVTCDIYLIVDYKNV
jgi:hypothetical protein